MKDKSQRIFLQKGAVVLFAESGHVAFKAARRRMVFDAILRNKMWEWRDERYGEVRVSKKYVEE